MDYRSEIRYRGMMEYRHGYRHAVGTKSGLERAMDCDSVIKIDAEPEMTDEEECEVRDAE